LRRTNRGYRGIYGRVKSNESEEKSREIREEVSRESAAKLQVPPRNQNCFEEEIL